MGFTLGLPPGFYAPDRPEIRNLVNKIRHMNGIILPSAITSTTPDNQIHQNKKTVQIGVLPSYISNDEIIQVVTSQLIHRKLVTSNDPVESCEILGNRYIAFLNMKTAKDAAAAVQMGSVIFENQVLKIKWPNLRERVATQSSVQADYFDKENTLDSLFIYSKMKLPEKDEIAALFEKNGFLVKDIVQPEGFNHALVNLNDETQADLAIIKLDRKKIDGVEIRIRRSFIAENEGPMALNSLERVKIRAASGPSKMLSVISPLLRENPCVADILNPDVPAAIVIHPETEKRQKPTGKILKIFNIASETVLFDANAYQELVNDVIEECKKYGEVVECRVEQLDPENVLPSDHPVVIVVFTKEDSAKEAQIALSGRRYEGRYVITQLAE